MLINSKYILVFFTFYSAVHTQTISTVLSDLHCVVQWHDWAAVSDHLPAELVRNSCSYLHHHAGDQGSHHTAHVWYLIHTQHNHHDPVCCLLECWE